MTAGVAILGSTGSIGRSTLQVLARQRDRFRVVALTAYSNRDLLDEQAREWKPGLREVRERQWQRLPGRGRHAS